jgi:hypothetical protein
VRVKMIAGISGTFDGNDWPARGEVADLPDAVAVDAIAAGFAEPASAVEVESADAGPLTAAAVRTGRKRS